MFLARIKYSQQRYIRETEEQFCFFFFLCKALLSTSSLQSSWGGCQKFGQDHMKGKKKINLILCHRVTAEMCRKLASVSSLCHWAGPPVRLSITLEESSREFSGHGETCSCSQEVLSLRTKCPYSSSVFSLSGPYVCREKQKDLSYP